MTKILDALAETSVEEFNQHIANLVALKSQEIVRGLEQRISDLEVLATQPEGAVTFIRGEAE